MSTVAWVGLGSALGGILRYLAAGWVQRTWPHALPVGTMAVNVSGCLIMGVLAGLRTEGGEPALKPEVREFLLTGVLGGYTTFSAFSLQTLALYRDGQPAWAFAYVVLSVALCLGSVAAGYALGRTLTGA